MRFAINKAGIKLIQSFNSVILTVTTRTYEATAAIANKVNAFIPIGKPCTTSVITPAKNINP